MKTGIRLSALLFSVIFAFSSLLCSVPALADTNTAAGRSEAQVSDGMAGDDSVDSETAAGGSEVTASEAQTSNGGQDSAASKSGATASVSEASGSEAQASDTQTSDGSDSSQVTAADGTAATAETGTAGSADGTAGSAGTGTTASAGTAADDGADGNGESETADSVETQLNDAEDIETELKNPQESLGSYIESDGSEEGRDYLIQEVDPEGPVFDGTVPEETSDQVNELFDYILNGTPATSDEVVSIVGKASDGLLSAEENALDLVTVQESSSLQGKSGYIYVVDENAAVFLVKDDDDNYIAGATVTISYTDDDGNCVTRSVETSGGGAPGIAAFNDMEGTRYGVVDITAKGYHSITLLEEEITGGNKKTFSLTKNSSDNEVYIRGVDLDGKDLMFSETQINLFDDNSDRMVFSILVSRTGNASIPGTLYLHSKTDGRKVATFSLYRNYDADTYLFVFSGNWVSKDANLLKDGDELQILFGTQSYDLSHVNVENAVMNPSFEDGVELPLAGGDGSNCDSAVPIKGVDRAKIVLSLLKLKVSAAIFPDGSFFIMAMIDLDSTKKGFNELMPKTTSPKTNEQMETIVDLVVAAYKKSVADLSQSMGTLRSQAEICHAYLSSNFVCNYGVMFTGVYNKDEGNFTGDFDFIFQVNYKFSDTIYCVVSAGPVVIPFYFGFEAGLAAKADVDVGFVTESIWGPYELSGKSGNVAFHLLPSVAAFLGVGVRGLLGLDLQTNIDFDLCYYPYNRDGDIGFIDAHADFRLNYYLLFHSGSVMFITTGKQRLLPSSESVLGEENASELQSIDLDLTEEQVVNQVSLTENEDGTITLPSYYMNSLLDLKTETVNGTQTISQISTNSYIDNQLQVIDTDDYTAMFRIISKDGKTKLVYQTQSNFTGIFKDQLYEIQVPDDQSVVEYCVVPAKAAYQGNRRNYVFIAAVCADESIEDLDERAASTSVCAVTINLLDNTELYCETVAPADGTYHFNPKPAGYWKQCIAAYSTCESYQDKTNYTSYMVNVDGDIVKIGDNTQFYTTGRAHDLEDPAFWYVNNETSDENTVRLEGMNANGVVPDSWTCHAELDVSDYDIDEGESYITGWWYEDTVDYFIAMGKVYYLEKYNTNSSDGSGNYNSLKAVELTFSDGKSAELGSAEGTYQIFSNRDASAVYIACATPVYSITDYDTLEAECSGTKIAVYCISYDLDAYKDRLSLHGTRDIYLDDVEMTSLSCAFNRKTGGNGLVIVYNESPDKTYNDIYEFQENASDGLIITNFDIQDPVVTNTQEWIAARVTLKNVGYKVSGLVGFKITDSSGTQLVEGLYNRTDGSIKEMSPTYYHWFEYIYPSDSASYMIYFRTNPNWKTDTAETLNITITLNGADDDTIYTTAEALNYAYTNGGEYETYGTSYTIDIDEPYLELDGEQTIVGGRHVAQLAIENSSILQAENVRIAMVGVYKGTDPSYDADTDLTAVNECLGTEKAFITALVNRNVSAGSYDAQSYNLDLDLESIWQSNKDTDLRGINLYLVDENGKKIDKQVVYMENPYYQKDESEPEPETETTTQETTTKKETETNSGKKNSNVKTGDANYTSLWIILAILAAAAAVGAVVWLRKKSDK